MLQHHCSHLSTAITNVPQHGIAIILNCFQHQHCHCSYNVPHCLHVDSNIFPLFHNIVLFCFINCLIVPSFCFISLLVYCWINCYYFTHCWPPFADHCLSSWFCHCQIKTRLPKTLSLSHVNVITSANRPYEKCTRCSESICRTETNETAVTWR